MFNYNKNIFFGVYEKSDWIIEDTYYRCKSFDNSNNFKDELIKTVDLSNSSLKLALLKAHPELTGKISMGELTRESLNEQNSAGLNRCSFEEFNELHELNKTYNEKFEFPFIIAVTGLNVIKILYNFRLRVLNDYETEFSEALLQVHKIAEIRINQIIKKME